MRRDINPRKRTPQLTSIPSTSAPEHLHVNYIKLHRKTKLVSLIGKQCLVNCRIDGVPVEALWDSGAQAPVINEAWRAENLPHTILRPIQELLGPEILTGLAANQTEIPFSGWVEVEFKLCNKEVETEALAVSILVSDDPGVAERPIIGYNVIEEVVKAQSPGSRVDPTTIQTLSATFSIRPRIARMVVKLIQTPDLRESVGVVTTGRRRVHLPANEVTTISVPARLGATFKGQEVLFTPSDQHSLTEGLEVTDGLVKTKNWEKRVFYQHPHRQHL